MYNSDVKTSFHDDDMALSGAGTSTGTMMREFGSYTLRLQYLQHINNGDTAVLH